MPLSDVCAEKLTKNCVEGSVAFVNLGQKFPRPFVKRIAGFVSESVHSGCQARDLPEDLTLGSSTLHLGQGGSTFERRSVDATWVPATCRLEVPFLVEEGPGAISIA
jgi:hypothetical protein